MSSSGEIPFIIPHTHKWRTKCNQGSRTASLKQLELFSWWASGREAAALEARFNVLKGSIPVRTDIDKSNFGPYHQWTMDALARDAVVLSCVHGEAAPSAFVRALDEDVSVFVADRDVDRFTAALVQAAKNSGVVK